MPSAVTIRRLRRKRDRPGPRWPSWPLAAMVVLAVFLLAAFGPASAQALGGVIGGLPDVSRLEALYGPYGERGLQPTLLYDRSGQHVLFIAQNSRGRQATWVDFSRAAADPGLSLVLQTAVQAEAGASQDGMRMIAESLAGRALLPLDSQPAPAWVGRLRLGWLGDRILKRYTSAQILDWYFNTAPYGEMTYGVDAAALTYFGKHANQLDLAEAAMLASIPQAPELNPVEAPERARVRQQRLLDQLAAAGGISADEAASAKAETIQIEAAAIGRAAGLESFAGYVWRQLSDRYAGAFSGRTGLTVITSLDLDLQQQLACVAGTQLDRLVGRSPSGVQPAADGSACAAASLLPPLRPGDAGYDHGLGEASAAVIDPASGEILAFMGEAASAQPAGGVLSPLVYLAAFARGYAPGSMVLDLPLAQPDAAGEVFQPGGRALSSYHGPVRMRVALANDYAAAAVRTAALVGAQTTERTIHQVGISGTDDPGLGAVALGLGEMPVSPLDLAFAYGVIANQGMMAGEHGAGSQDGGGLRALDPISVLSIADGAGNRLAQVERQRQAVLSPALAFLMEDVLSDETARWLAYSHPNPLEIGRPAGAKVGTAPDGRGFWAAGFTPERSAAVWAGATKEEAPRHVDPINSVAAIWHAIIHYASRDSQALGWRMPAGISELQVCDPSGLLPTEICPHVVREVFIQGTEPTHPDNLYQPFDINRDTGNLATLFTPPDQVEARVYFIPPPEAAEWARETGLPQPPESYDTLQPASPGDAMVSLASPSPFDVIRGTVSVRGTAALEGMSSYRLQAGFGLNPAEWLQIGEASTQPVRNGLLGVWDTSGLEGLVTLQLLAVDGSGRLTSAAILVTVDNQPPDVKIVQPVTGQVVPGGGSHPLTIEADASDNLALDRVEIYIDGIRIASMKSPPFVASWANSLAGLHTILAKAYDTAGNVAESKPVVLQATP
jgi:membrane peptidoglycan carboxypeptidase